MVERESTESCTTQIAQRAKDYPHHESHQIVALQPGKRGVQHAGELQPQSHYPERRKPGDIHYIAVVRKQPADSTEAINQHSEDPDGKNQSPFPLAIL